MSEQLSVRQHTTQPSLFVAYNQDGSEAAHMRLMVSVHDLEAGAFVTPMFRIVWCPEHVDHEDELSTPARPA